MPETDKATPRPNAYGTPWEYENVSICSDRSGHGVVKDDNGKILFDSMNSDVATIATEHDECGVTYFDAAGHYYLSHAVRCVNAHAALVAALKGLLHAFYRETSEGDGVAEQDVQTVAAAEAALKLAEAP